MRLKWYGLYMGIAGCSGADVLDKNSFINALTNTWFHMSVKKTGSFSYAINALRELTLQ
jgi:hypothetical protein